VKLTYCFRE